jgi:hypothetical protein
MSGLNQHDWSGIKIGNLPEKTRLSWYQSLAKNHLWIYVIFNGGLSIPLTRKSESRKTGLFPNGEV